MAGCAFDKKEINKKGYLTMNESACGSGANIIALAETIKERGYNPSTTLLFKAQDLDETCIYMCYLQTSLIGLSGLCVLGNTLSGETKKTLITPMFLNKTWKLKYAKKQIEKLKFAFETLSESQKKHINKQLTLDLEIKGSTL